MAALSCVLIWETPWTEKPGELQSMGSQKKVRHISVTKMTTKRTSLVVQWLRLYLPMQGARVQTLVGDPTCSTMWPKIKKKKMDLDSRVRTIKPLKEDIGEAMYLFQIGQSSLIQC